MGKILVIGDTHLGLGYPNSVDKWFKVHQEYFSDFLIPFIKKNLTEDDTIVHLGDLFDNRTVVPINILNYAQNLIEDMSKICPIHILVGNHDLYNKSTNEVNTTKLYKYIPNVHVYEEPTIIKFNDRKILMMPWVEKKQDQIEILKKWSGCDYLFCHSDLNGAKMHLTSVAHKNNDKIDVEEFSGYRNVYSGHIHLVQKNKNFTFVGSIFQMDRNDMGNQKGIFLLDTINLEEEFIENKKSPIYKKINILQEEDILKLDGLSTRDYIDLFISNSLLMNNRKLRRKLELILETGNFASVEYIDDLKIEENKKEKYNNENDESEIKLPRWDAEFNDIVKEYVNSQKYESDKIKYNIIEELNEIIRLYEENWKN